MSINDIIKIISPKELLSKLSAFKQKLESINQQNERLRLRMKEQSEHKNDSDDGVHGTPQAPIARNQSEQSGFDAELQGVVLGRRGQTCKVQLTDTDENLTNTIIDIHEKYVHR